MGCMWLFDLDHPQFSVRLFYFIPPYAHFFSLEHSFSVFLCSLQVRVMESVLETNVSFKESVLVSLDNAISERNPNEIKRLLLSDDAVALITDNLSEIVSCTCKWICKLHTSAGDNVLLSLVEFLETLSFRFDVGECLLLVTGQLGLLRGKPASMWLLKPLAHCVMASGFTRFSRITPVLDEITQNLSLLTSSGSHLQHLFSYTTSAVDFYTHILTGYPFGEVGNRDSYILRHILFLFSCPFILLSDVPGIQDLLHRTLQLIPKLCCCSLYKFFIESYEELCLSCPRPDSNGTPAFIMLPAWLRILSYLFFNVTPHVHNFWPLVFSRDYHFVLAYDLLRNILNVDNRSMFLEPNTHAVFKPMSDYVYDSVQLYAISVLLKLVSICNHPLSLAWWTEKNVILLDILKHLAIRPVSGESLPRIVTEAVAAVDRLLSLSTYSAQFHLFSRLLKPNHSQEHHGWRGHLITVCKDYIHKAWMDCLERDIKSVIHDERARGEEEVTLPLHTNTLGHLCELIFVYPIPSSRDPLIDQSSWVLAALNMALFLLIRCDAVRNDPRNSVDCQSVLDGLLRKSGLDSHLYVSFLRPLNAELSTELQRYEAQIHVLETESSKTDCNQKEKRRLLGQLDVANSTMLRLRLMRITLDRVNKALKDCSVTFSV
ncbi:unnamed protein product [Dicrocoelium dendriticum]|nr:unnamed protein product [Dicrocoelium dendriticum]